MLKNDRLGTKTWRLVSLLACTAAPFAGCSGHEDETVARGASQALVGEGIVISQLYTAGGNAGPPVATFNRDFVEVFNRSNVPVSLAGLSLQYGSNTGNFGGTLSDGGLGGNVYIFPSNVTLAPGQYFLVGMGSTSATNGAALPEVNDSGTLNMGATNGKIALARTVESLSCGSSATPCDSAKIVDIVAFGNATPFEGTGATAALNTTLAALRKDAGCIDANDNKNDFTVETPAPRNAASAAHVCATDGGAPDAEVDANPGIDAGSPDDAGPADGGGGTPEDGGGIDAAPEDAGPADAGPEDAGPVDAGPGDASTDGGNDAGPPGDGTGVVISQIFGAGGNSGASFSRDYVELFNRSNGPVSLAGLSVQYGSATGDFSNNSFTAPVVLPNVTLPKGGYFLVAFAGGDAGTGAGLPKADAEGLTNFSATKAKVALARVITPLGCGGATRCPDTNIVDKVGYGDNTVTDWLGNSRAPAPAGGENTTSIVRKNNGCQDTRNNDADFALTKPATVPHNSESTPAPCSETPTDAGTDSGTGRADAGKSDGGTGNPFDSGTPPRNDGGSGNGAVDVDSGCSCSTPGSSTPMNKGLAFATFAALGLAITARRRRAS
ncbi:lamin tail domain-containing protein [Pendulispora brunnea]|uniref:Lamin tail domain-containing protein n=1 Tax=Pendulispora brunnea TaxID=2905690 RepID=A0ABZ2KE66_9BACT